MEKILSLIRKFFCFHDYTIPKEYDDISERDKIVFNLKRGQSVAFSRLHRCLKCGNEKMIGSGIIY